MQKQTKERNTPWLLMIGNNTLEELHRLRYIVYVNCGMLWYCTSYSRVARMDGGTEIRHDYYTLFDAPTSSFHDFQPQFYSAIK